MKTERQLYNLDEDPYEMRNLWEERPEIIARLQALLAKYEAEDRSVPRRRNSLLALKQRRATRRKGTQWSVEIV